jgi:hypothetical protein
VLKKPNSEVAALSHINGRVDSGPQIEGMKHINAGDSARNSGHLLPTQNKRSYPFDL